MAVFPGFDGTRLAYHRLADHRLADHPTGQGRPLVCLPGGPMQVSSYLGDLGGLAAEVPLVRLDLRGTGDSAVPADPETYRCDRQVADVEALRAHLELDRIDLLGHSAGANLAVGYAARHPDRIDRLVLLTPSPRAVDLPVSPDDRRQAAERRHGEPWFPAAFAALERIVRDAGSSEDWQAIKPFMYGRWDEATQAHAAAEQTGKNQQAAGYFAAEGAFDPASTRAGLAGLGAPVLVVAGGSDLQLPPGPAAGYAGLFRRGELAVLPGGGHFPWLDDPGWFVRTVADFLRQPAG